MKLKLQITMHFLVGCQSVIVLALASTPAAQLNAMVVSGSPNQRFVNEHSNRSSRRDLEFLDYTNPEEKRKRLIESWQEENPAQHHRSISMTLEQLLIERPNASSSFDYMAKKQEITTADTYRKSDDRGSRFFVNQMLVEREGNEERPLTDLNERSVTENRKELLQSEALSLKKRATGNSTLESSSRKETTEILNRKIDVRSRSTSDLQDKEIPSTVGIKSGKKSRQLTPEMFEVVEPLHQQTTNSKPIRTQHLQNTREESNSPQALPLYRFNSQKTKHLATPLSVRLRKRKSRYSRQNSAQLNAAVAYQRALQALHIGSNDHSTRVPAFGLNQPQFSFNPTQINNAIREEGFDAVPLGGQNFRKIPNNQVAFIPPKIIYETRILPAPFMTDDPQQKEFHDFSNFFTRVPITESRENEFDFASYNGQQHTSIPIKESIPVTEKTSDEEALLTTTEVSLPPDSSEISNHRYETAVPIIKSVPLNHKLHNENVDETEGNPPQLEYSELTGGTSEFSQKEDIHNSNSRNTYPRYAGKYTFGYRVSDHETGNDFGHEERRDGDVTRGGYHVLLPDGRIQNVKYHVDHQGYHAKVSYHYDH